MRPQLRGSGWISPGTGKEACTPAPPAWAGETLMQISLCGHRLGSLFWEAEACLPSPGVLRRRHDAPKQHFLCQCQGQGQGEKKPLRVSTA